jgi:glycosyltransferase involved in cell wall biosynthesis
VQPSIFEGFGLTIAEAIAAKVPVITSDLEGPIEVIDGGHYGVSFQCGNASDLASKIMLFYNKDITVNIYAAWNFARENFDINAATQKYLDAYKTLVHR